MSDLSIELTAIADAIEVAARGRYVELSSGTIVALAAVRMVSWFEVPATGERHLSVLLDAGDYRQMTLSGADAEVMVAALRAQCWRR